MVGLGHRFPEAPHPACRHLRINILKNIPSFSNHAQHPVFWMLFWRSAVLKTAGICPELLRIRACQEQSHLSLANSVYG